VPGVSSYDHSPSCRSGAVIAGSYIVVFVDILGVSALLEQIADDEESLSRIIHHFNSLFRVIRDEAVAIADGQSFVRGFSDCFVIARPWCLNARCLSHNRSWIRLRLARLQMEIVRAGYLIRGAAVLGAFGASDMTMMGEGLARAYRLESTVAQVPRILLEAELVAALGPDTTGFRLDADGYWFVDFLRAPVGVAVWDEVVEQLTSLTKALVDSRGKNPKLAAKGDWLFSYLRSVGEPKA
jgi:hypothetical protein